jgi:hypothetical protein
VIRQHSLLLFLAVAVPAFCHAQAPDPAPAASPQTPASPPVGSTTPSAPTDKPKKVWTNDDMKNTGSVSVVGDKRNQQYTMTKPADTATIAKYRTNLQKLQTQLDDVNKQLKAFEDVAEGKPVTEGGQDVSHGYSRMPVNQQTARLLDKKKQLTDQIDDLYDEARKKGIESGQLK